MKRNVQRVLSSSFLPSWNQLSSDTGRTKFESKDGIPNIWGNVRWLPRYYSIHQFNFDGVGFRIQAEHSFLWRKTSANHFHSQWLASTPQYSLAFQVHFMLKPGNIFNGLWQYYSKQHRSDRNFPSLFLPRCLKSIWSESSCTTHKMKRKKNLEVGENMK